MLLFAQKFLFSGKLPVFGKTSLNLTVEVERLGGAPKDQAQAM